MKPKELLSRLSNVESLLNEFSFEELGSKEATSLKRTFELFKKQLQHNIEGIKLSNNTVPTVSNRIAACTCLKPSSQVDLIANVGNALGTPLNDIIRFADLLKEGYLDKEKLLHVTAIQKASFSLLDIQDELLEYAKLAAGEELFEAIHFNFHRLVRDAIFLSKTLIVQTNVSLELSMNPSIPKVLIGDPTKLMQILLSLLGKAIKCVEEGTVVLRILLQKRKTKGLRFQFEITVNGIYTDAAYSPFILGAMKKCSRETIEEGTSLKLAIIQQMVTQLGGDISVISNLGKEVKFNLSLPFTEGNISRLENQKTKTSISGTMKEKENTSKTENSKSYTEFDMSHIVEELMGDIDMIEELILLYKQNILEFVELMQSHLDKKDIDGIQFSAHKLKFGLAFMRAESLREIVLQMERSCKTDRDLTYLTVLFERFNSEYPEVEKQIDVAFKKLKNKK
ncbi:ATP-binding protein [bacterium]|nr:ATP-binding protein [bacterium]